jgi:hypothetical protein
MVDGAHANGICHATGPRTVRTAYKKIMLDFRRPAARAIYRSRGQVVDENHPRACSLRVGSPMVTLVASLSQGVRTSR